MRCRLHELHKRGRTVAAVAAAAAPRNIAVDWTVLDQKEVRIRFHVDIHTLIYIIISKSS